MTTTETTRRIAVAAPRHRGKLIGAYYLLTILTGLFVLFYPGKLAFAADLIATVFYVAMTVLFYELSTKRLSGGDRRPDPHHDRTF